LWSWPRDSASALSGPSLTFRPCSSRCGGPPPRRSGPSDQAAGGRTAQGQRPGRHRIIQKRFLNLVTRTVEACQSRSGSGGGRTHWRASSPPPRRLLSSGPSAGRTGGAGVPFRAAARGPVARRRAAGAGRGYRRTRPRWWRGCGTCARGCGGRKCSRRSCAAPGRRRESCRTSQASGRRGAITPHGNTRGSREFFRRTESRG